MLTRLDQIEIDIQKLTQERAEFCRVQKWEEAGVPLALPFHTASAAILIAPVQKGIARLVLSTPGYGWQGILLSSAQVDSLILEFQAFRSS